jgi:5-oxoprolinase (ATP-hydrolysing)
MPAIIALSCRFRASGRRSRPLARGDGAVRKVRFLEPMTASILSNRRRVPPFGLDSGGPGAVGLNYVLRADGGREDLPGCAAVEMKAGDVFVIETPGGGGFGNREA